MSKNASAMSPGDWLQKQELNIGGAMNPKKISHIRFGVLSGPDMVRASEMQVSSRLLYKMATREPAPNGCLDPRLGTSDKQSVCQTCGHKLSDCTGHFGYIELELPVFHIGYYKALHTTLQCVCKDCSRVLLPAEERAKYMKMMTNPTRDSISKTALRKKIVERCKRVTSCSRCGAINGTVRKVPGACTLKLVHERQKSKLFLDDEEGTAEYNQRFETAIAQNKDVGTHLSKSMDSLNPLVVLQILKAIPDEDLPLLWAHPVYSRPERLILTHLLVPPVAIRPSVKMEAGSGSNEDDLTMKLQEIVHINNALRTAVRAGATMKMVVEDWDFLQVQVAQYFNGELPGLPPSLRKDKPIRGLVQRMKGKQGRFRGNLSGKRVDFSGRTVISPDPNLKVHEVGIPRRMAMTLTYPETVQNHNIERLRRAVLRGPKRHPGANFVRPGAGIKGVSGTGKALSKYLAFADRRRTAAELVPGDIVERHLVDGDVVLFNRQPSLHKLSIMSHRAKILEGRTLRFNECVCAPYNADFDGDEMNLHVPQTEEAKAEADTLMSVVQNLVTPRNGEPLVSATQDFITASFLMTQRDVFLSRDQVCSVLARLGDAAEHVELPVPSILLPTQLWTGKQVWSVLLMGGTQKLPSSHSGGGMISGFSRINLVARERQFGGIPTSGPQADEAQKALEQLEAAQARLDDLSTNAEGDTTMVITSNVKAVRARNRSESVSSGSSASSSNLSQRRRRGGKRSRMEEEAITDRTPMASEVQNSDDDTPVSLPSVKISGEAMCPNEGYVVFRNSELMCGTLGKTVLGGSKSGLFYVLIRDQSNEEAARAMTRMTKCVTRWFRDYGFSIGIDDVTPSPRLVRLKKEAIRDGYSKCKDNIEKFAKGTLQARPGCNLEESLESEISGILSRVRDVSGKKCMNELPRRNAPLIMAVCGSKGSSLNICQMVACVGQQIVGGKRMPDGFVRRTLPHFREIDSKSPVAKGFVANSFYSGLTAPEFFFHTMGGREGLVDTAVKTAETGYMARRLMKALEDLSVRYDSTVRNSSGCIVQFTYGDDGLNPVFMEKGDRPVDWQRLHTSVVASFPDASARALTADELVEACKEEMSARPKLRVHMGSISHGIARNDKGAAPAVVKSEPGTGGTESDIEEDESATDSSAASSKRSSKKRQRQGICMGSAGSDTQYTTSAETKTGQKIAAALSKGEETRGLGAGMQFFAKEFWKFVCDDLAGRVRRTTKLGDAAENANTPTNGSGFTEWTPPPSQQSLSSSIVEHTCRTTRTQLKLLLEQGMQKYERAIVEPGEAVGAIGAQSLGEPGTQMTLKTFHFAGVASMNVTLGVPRIKEIINASKAISTPIITVALECDDDERSARIIKGRVECTYLGETGCSLRINLALEAIESLHLDGLTASSVKDAILRTPKLKLKPSHITVNDRSGTVVITPPANYGGSSTRKVTATSGSMSSAGGEHSSLFFAMQALKTALITQVSVQGIPTVQRAVVNVKNDEGEASSKGDGTGQVDGGKRFHLLVEGLGLQAVMAVPGVCGPKTTTNHIMEMEEVLGIEAARTLVMTEVAYIFGRYGLAIDRRHLMLLADVMSYRGQILGITRFGIAKMKESVLMLASFEKTADHLFDAAVHARQDKINGVSECIIMGTPIPLGTGMFKLLSDPNAMKNARKESNRSTAATNGALTQCEHLKLEIRRLFVDRGKHTFTFKQLKDAGMLDLVGFGKQGSTPDSLMLACLRELAEAGTIELPKSRKKQGVYRWSRVKEMPDHLSKRIKTEPGLKRNGRNAVEVIEAAPIVERNEVGAILCRRRPTLLDDA